MQTLLYGAQIITQNEQDEIHKEGWILLEDDRIIGIGAGAPPEVPEGTVKRCLPGRVIMPGIVNIHTHVGGTLFKGLTEDIKGAFYGLAFPMERFITRESMYSISMLGAMEAVKFGSTFIDDLYHFPESTARAAEELGLRGIIAQKIYDPDLQNLHNNDYSSVPGRPPKSCRPMWTCTKPSMAAAMAASRSALLPTPPIPSPSPWPKRSQQPPGSTMRLSTPMWRRLPRRLPTTGKPMA